MAIYIHAHTHTRTWLSYVLVITQGKKSISQRVKTKQLQHHLSIALITYI